MKQLPFNACDYRCERCLVTSECAVFQKLREYSLLDEMDKADRSSSRAILEAIRESFRETETIIKQKAREFGIDIDAIAGGSAEAGSEEQRGAHEDGLYRRCADFSSAAHRFLGNAADVVTSDTKAYLDDIGWHHTIIPAKIFRAVSWRTDGDEIAMDGKNSAAVAMNSLTICNMAFDHLAAGFPALAEECRRLSREGKEIKEEIRRRFSP